MNILDIRAEYVRCLSYSWISRYWSWISIFLYASFWNTISNQLDPCYPQKLKPNHFESHPILLFKLNQSELSEKVETESIQIPPEPTFSKTNQPVLSKEVQTESIRNNFSNRTNPWYPNKFKPNQSKS